MKPRIFIGSSTEGLAVAQRIKHFLSQSMIVIFGMTVYFNLMKAFWKPYLSLQVCLTLVL